MDRAHAVPAPPPVASVAPPTPDASEPLASFPPPEISPGDPAFVGPADYRGLEHWADRLPELTAVPDDFVGPRGPGQPTEAELMALREAWARISHDEGLRLDGAPADREALRQVLRADMIGSPALQDVVREIGGDHDPAHEVRGSVGRHQQVTGSTEPVRFDNFETGQIDVDDFEALQRTPGTSEQRMTSGELLAHVLAERRVAALSDDPHDFGAAHAAAIGAQNGVREERGQKRVAQQEMFEGSDIVTTFEDGDVMASAVMREGEVWSVE